MTAMNDWAEAQLLKIGANPLLSVTSEGDEDLTGVCVPAARRGEVTAHNNSDSRYCFCEETDVDVVSIASTVLGTGFDDTKTAILAAIQADYGAASAAEATRRCVALLGELLYPGLMPGGE